MNKPRKVTDKIKQDAYDGIQMLLEQYPGGVPAVKLWEQLLEGNYSYSYTTSALSELEREGYLIGNNNGYPRKSKTYTPTGKQITLIPDTTMDYLTKPAPPKKETNPGDPQYWLDDLNKIINSLCDFQEAIPKLKAGLLDLTKNLDRLSKVKDILCGVEKAARRNV